MSEHVGNAQPRSAAHQRGAKDRRYRREPKKWLGDAEAALAEGRRMGAIGLLRAAAREHPQDFDIAFNLGELCREAGDVDGAVSSLRVAAGLRPEDGSAHFCLGAALYDQGDREAAIAAYRLALACDSLDAEAAINLGATLGECGRLQESIEVLKATCKHHPALYGAWTNLAESQADGGDVEGAVRTLEKALESNPGCAPLHFSMGRMQLRNGQGIAAVHAFDEAVRLDGNNSAYVEALCDCLEDMEQYNAALLVLEAARTRDPAQFPPDERYARLLGRVGRIGAAEDVYTVLLEASPDDHRLLTGLANLMLREGRVDRARSLLDRALELAPNHAAIQFNRGVVAQVEGDFELATRRHRDALRLSPRCARAALNLALNRSSNVTTSEIQSFTRATEDPGLSWDERVNFEFALGQLHHDRGDHQRAFAHFRSGNAIKASRIRFDPEGHEAQVSGTIDQYAAGQRVDDGPGDSDPLMRPIFIVGMPRCGSTLVETLLAGSPQILALGESPIAARAFASASKTPPDDEAVAHLRDLIVSQWRDAPGYREDVRVCDKMLGNLFHLGIISRVFPQATVIDCLRHPVATCLSCYFQNFDHGLRFTYDLEHLVCFYRQYRRLMTHWQSVLPLRIVDLHYESLVHDAKSALRGLGEIAGVAFEAGAPAALRSVNTASFWQARQPIYRDAVESWRNYESYIPQLLALNDEGAN